jgi:hypothetical protein
MGFLDKAKKAAQDAAQQGKKLAEQAQSKLDEAQGNFNAGQQHSQEQPAGAGTEYDKHGRPIAHEDTAQTAPPHGDPVAESAPSAPAAEAPAPDPAAPGPEPVTPGAEPPKPPAPPSGGSGLTSGDPLAG